MTTGQIYAEFLTSTDCPWCWHCGRGFEHKPENWFGPWIIERAHVVNNPRREDRRAVILLCSWCHRVQHGEQLVLPGMFPMVVPSVANMLWLKREFDPKFYDRQWLAKHCIGTLPRAKNNVEAYENYRRLRLS